MMRALWSLLYLSCRIVTFLQLWIQYHRRIIRNKVHSLEPCTLFSPYNSSSSNSSSSGGGGDKHVSRYVIGCDASTRSFPN